MADEAPLPPTPEVVTIDQYLEKVMCDFGHKFHSNSAKLIPFRNTSASSLGEIMFVDNDHFVRLSLDSTPDTGFFLACPVCGVIHIEGFSVIGHDEEALENTDVAPERNIQLGL